MRFALINTKKAEFPIHRLCGVLGVSHSGYFARRIVGWRVSRTAHAGFLLDALEQALHERRPVRGGLNLSRNARSGRRLPAIATFLPVGVATTS